MDVCSIIQKPFKMSSNAATANPSQSNDEFGLLNTDALPQRPPRKKRRRPQEPALENTHKEENHATKPKLEENTSPTEPADAPPPLPDDLPAYRSAAEGDYKFEYLDHTADVQLHAWGANLKEAFQNVALAMYNYMTPLTGISITTDKERQQEEGNDNDNKTRQFYAQGHDMQSLVFNFLDEILFNFTTDFFVCKNIQVTSLDTEHWKIEAVGKGEVFDQSRHVSGTEIKAITYSAMQINETPNDAEIFVIVDI